MLPWGPKIHLEKNSNYVCFFCLSSLHFDFSLSSETPIPPPQKKNHAIFLAGTKPCSGRDDQETRWGSELSDCESLSFMDGSSDVGCFRNPFSKNVTKQSYGKIEQHLTQTYACQSLVVSKTFKQEGSDCAIEENRFVQPTLKYIYIDMYMYIYI